MDPYERDRLELGDRLARGLHYQHARNLRLLEGREAFEADWQATTEGAVEGAAQTIKAT